MRKTTFTSFEDFDDAMIASARDDGSTNVLVALGNSGSMTAVLNPTSRQEVADAFTKAMRYEPTGDTEVTVFGFENWFDVTGVISIG